MVYSLSVLCKAISHVDEWPLSQVHLSLATARTIVLSQPSGLKQGFSNFFVLQSHFRKIFYAPPGGVAYTLMIFKQ